MYELHVRSNDYKSPYVMEIMEHITELTVEGVDVESNEARDFLMNRGLVVANCDFDEEHRAQIQGMNLPKSRSLLEHRAVRNVREVVIERLMTINKSVAFLSYDLWCFGATRGFIRCSLGRSDLCDGVRWLVAIRVNAFPAVNSCWERISRTGGVPPFRKDHCPLCDKAISSDYGWVHLLVECLHQPVVLSREKFLSEPIRNLGSLTTRHNTLPMVKDVVGLSTETGQSGVIAIHLAGGVVNDDGFHHSYHLGYGQLDLVPFGLSTYGYVYAASFLQEVAPLFTTALRARVYEVELLGGTDDLEPEGSLFGPWL